MLARIVAQAAGSFSTQVTTSYRPVISSPRSSPIAPEKRDMTLYFRIVDPQPLAFRESLRSPPMTDGPCASWHSQLGAAKDRCDRTCPPSRIRLSRGMDTREVIISGGSVAGHPVGVAAVRATRAA